MHFLLPSGEVGVYFRGDIHVISVAVPDDVGVNVSFWRGVDPTGSLLPGEEKVGNGD